MIVSCKFSVAVSLRLVISNPHEILPEIYKLSGVLLPKFVNWEQTSWLLYFFKILTNGKLDSSWNYRTKLRITKNKHNASKLKDMPGKVKLCKARWTKAKVVEKVPSSLRYVNIIFKSDYIQLLQCWLYLMIQI